MKKSILIGVAGGTGSGKTSMAKNIVRDFDPSQVVIIEQDSYYFDLVDIPLDTRNHHNFDHPEAYDFDLLKTQLRDLIDGKAVAVPIYDYKTHTRSKEAHLVSGHKIIVLEGIMVLFDPELRDMMDIKIYIHTAPDIRFIRRLSRDIRYRGRSVESVIHQYLDTVRPMHEQFVEPTKQCADIIIPEGGHNTVAVDLFKTKVKSLLSQLAK
ncbi:MAG: uridine kinase [Candidatus Marinimicrobia bacterium]|nr:uridine kinase [Candidatus Neomarinimicrobiota bacterium]MBL7067452.1 uridine kinase [Candidatus Neomarinimicrobiota bacterium]